MALNPFDLRGPEFLVFYAVFAALLTFLLWRMGQAEEKAESGTYDLSQDPYEIAYLRGGKPHALHVALLSLIDRNLLEVHDKDLKTIGTDSEKKVRRRLEKLILGFFQKGDKASEVFSDPEVDEEVELIGDRLTKMGLLPDEELKSRRRKLYWMGVLLLWGVSGIKIAVALSRGHHNILFLILLTLIATFAVRKVTRSFRTAMGNRELSNLESSFSGLYDGRSNVRLHRPTFELTLLAALFGMSALPQEAAAMVKPLKFRREGSAGCGTGCAGGSSCSGGSCGGGCGGGCGGCGG
jgi:uncharacterized protein (TIGR04222 family)